MRTKALTSSILLLLIISHALYATRVPLEKAQLIANNWYAEKDVGTKNIIFDKASIITGLVLASKKHEEVPLLYIFNVAEDNGFVIVAADDAIKPVLGYSFTGHYSETQQAPAFNDLLEFYKAQIAYVIENQVQVSTGISSEWEKYSSGNFTPETPAGVAPLLTTQWDQNCFYNDSCPAAIGGPCNKTLTGCGATAMAQVLKYHNYPTTGFGSNSYADPTYGQLSVNFGATTYNYANMPNSLSTNQADVAQLIYHCGVSFESKYNINGTSFSNQPLREALVDYFGYSSSAQMLSKYNFSDSAWAGVLIKELDAGRPILYSGSWESVGVDGHSFICDGYQDSSYFHFNMGWGGTSDGFYTVSPSNNYIKYFQGAIIGIEPSTGNCSGITELMSIGSKFDDGSGISDYQNNADCKWLIQPNGASTITLIFSSINLEQGADFVKVYDGDNTNAPLLGSFSGTNLYPRVESSGGSMLVHFTSDNNGTATGWTATYTSTRPIPQCSGFELLINPIGSIDDGSDNNDYQFDADCIWLIQPPSATSITLTFDSLETEMFCDIISVYDGDNASKANLLGKYSGNILPSAIVSNTGSMLLHFTSDFALSYTGWHANYTTSYLPGIVEENEISLINVFPNPSNGRFTLSIENVTGPLDISVLNMFSQTVHKERVENPAESNYTKEIDLSNYSKGVYYIMAVANGEIFSYKTVIQ